MNSFIRPRSGGLIETAVAAPPAEVDVTVVMVVYRTGPALKESLARVLADPDVGEFVVVDNGSSPAEMALMDAAAASGRRVQILRGQGNVGFARGCNLAASASHGRVLVVLNPDAFLEPGCIHALVSALRNQPSPCLVGARVMNPDGTEQRGARRGEVTPITTLLSFTHLSRRVSALKGFEIHQEYAPAPTAPVPVPTISGACFAITRADFAAVGGFDEGYFLHVEDVDLCWRVRKSGGVVLFHPEAKVVHLGSTSLKAPIQIEYWKGLGLARYFRKRAETGGRRVVAYLLAPLIIAVSVARPVLRGQALRRRPSRTP